MHLHSTVSIKLADAVRMILPATHVYWPPLEAVTGDMSNICSTAPGITLPLNNHDMSGLGLPSVIQDSWILSLSGTDMLSVS